MSADPDSIRTMSQAAMHAEMLDAETELALARAWHQQRDEKALHRLVSAYMRLAISMASKYRHYGAPVPDLIQEAGVGLMKAAEKFDPERGVRFSTYAMWRIKASIQEYVMRNWSMVRTGSTSSQKSLFFNLRRLRAKFEREAGADGVTLTGHDLRGRIAAELGVPLRDVEMMEARMAGADFSLNVQQAGTEGREWIELLEDDAPRAEVTVQSSRDTTKVRDWLVAAMHSLTARERLIVLERKLKDEPRTLESLGVELGVSKERIRQLEAQALRKLRHELEAKVGNVVEMLIRP